MLVTAIGQEVGNVLLRTLMVMVTLARKRVGDCLRLHSGDISPFTARVQFAHRPHHEFMYFTWTHWGGPKTIMKLKQIDFVQTLHPSNHAMPDPANLNNDSSPLHRVCSALLEPLETTNWLHLRHPRPRLLRNL